MDKPCIVCQENCPVSPKAIFTREYFSTLNMSRPLVVSTAGSKWVELNAEIFKPDQYATGDYYCILDKAADRQPHKIVSNTTRHLEIDPGNPFAAPPATGERIQIQVRLQRPYLDPERCIGCGVCQHECPVQGKRAVRVTADNETRAREHAMLLRNE
jgi:formate hydrogenlyase subunit 6/NADH:ubiquinone oxidoreductase subunit I